MAPQSADEEARVKVIQLVSGRIRMQTQAGLATESLFSTTTL